MFTHGTPSGSLLFNLIRVSPLATAAMLGALSAFTDVEQSEAAIGRLLVLSVVVVVWSMAESTILLWHRVKQRGGGASRGYGFVAFLLGAALLGVLNIFRARSSQSLFLVTLAMISVRGMSRAGWEQGRPRVAFGGAIIGASLLSLLSFLTVSPDINWQKIAFSVAVGSAVAAVEAAWFGTALKQATETPWAIPLFRLVLFMGPVIVATMALAGYLPIPYGAVYILIPFAARIMKRASESGINLTSCYRATAGVYGGFVGIIIACLLYMASR
jgi:hypothetical protein